MQYYIVIKMYVYRIYINSIQTVIVVCYIVFVNRLTYYTVIKNPHLLCDGTKPEYSHTQQNTQHKKVYLLNVFFHSRIYSVDERSTQHVNFWFKWSSPS
jgi:hypothetical protein